MPRKSPDDLEKVTLNLFRGDYSRLSTTYPQAGAALIIRRLIRKHLTDLESLRVNPGTNVPPADLLDDLGPGDDRS